MTSEAAPEPQDPTVAQHDATAALVEDGTVAKKGLAQIHEVTDYVRAHNEIVFANGGRHPETGREKLREILLSGGDPMVLSNTKLAAWLGALAEAGVESIRIGTKELAFYPQRFDDAFLGEGSGDRKARGDLRFVQAEGRHAEYDGRQSIPSFQLETSGSQPIFLG